MDTKTIMRKGGITMGRRAVEVEEEVVEVQELPVEEVIDLGTVKYENTEKDEDPQLPEEGEEVNEVYTESVPDTDSKIILTITNKGGVGVEIIGDWKGRAIRAIPGVINKAFRQRRLQKYKETQNIGG
jgi:hypothetical protein